MLSAINYTDLYVIAGGAPASGTNKVYYEVNPALYAAQADDGTTITATIITKRMSHGSAAIKKTVQTVMPEIALSTLTTVTGSVTYHALSDNNNISTAARTFTITPGAVGIIEEKYGVNVQCRKIQHVLTDNIVGAYVYYNQITESGTLDKQL